MSVLSLEALVLVESDFDLDLLLADAEALEFVADELQEAFKKPWKKEQHPRWPPGTPRGGEFMKVGQRFELNGVEYEVALARDKKLIAHVASGQYADAKTVELKGTKGPDGIVLEGAKPAAPKKIIGTKFQSSNVTVISPYVETATHDSSIPVPQGWTAEQWARFGKLDQENYLDVHERFGDWQPSLAKSLHDQVFSDYESTIVQLVKSGYQSQYGSSSGDSLSLASIFHKYSDPKKAMELRERCKELQGDLAAVIHWDLYNRTKSPDLLIFHKTGDATATWEQSYIQGTHKVFSGLSQSWKYNSNWGPGIGGPTAIATPAAIRTILMSSYTASAVSHSYAKEYEVSIPEQLKLDDRSIAFNPPKSIIHHAKTGGITLTPQQHKWLVDKTDKPAGGYVLDMLREGVAGNVDLQGVAAPPNIVLFDANAQAPEPPAGAASATKGWKVPTPGVKVEPADLATMDLDVKFVITENDGKTPQLLPAKDSGFQAGDYMLGKQGTLYWIGTDLTDAYGLRYYKIVDGQFNGESYGFGKMSGGSGTSKFYRLTGPNGFTFPEPKVETQAHTAFDASQWANGDKQEFVGKLKQGDKFKVEGLTYEMQVDGTMGAGTAKIKSLESGQVATINTDYKATPLIPTAVAPAVEEPAGPQALVFSPQAGDVFPFDGVRWTVTSVLKDGTIRAKAQGDTKGAKIEVGSHFHTQIMEAGFFRPGDWMHNPGQKVKLSSLAEGDIFDVGTGAKMRPAIVTGKVHKTVKWKSLETGQHGANLGHKTVRQIIPKGQIEPAPKNTPVDPSVAAQEGKFDLSQYKTEGSALWQEIPSGGLFLMTGKPFKKLDENTALNLQTNAPIASGWADGQGKPGHPIHSTQLPLLVSKGTGPVSYLDLSKGDVVTISALKQGDYFTMPDVPGLQVVVEESDGDPDEPKVVTAKVMPDGSHGHVGLWPQSASVTFESHVPPVVPVPGPDDGPTGPQEADTDGLPDAVHAAGYVPYKSGYGPGGKYKHDKIKLMAVGQQFRDKSGAVWVVKQSGPNAVISNGEKNYAIDGELRGRALDKPTLIDSAPPLGEVKPAEAKAWDGMSPVEGKTVGDFAFLKGEKFAHAGEVYEVKSVGEKAIEATGVASGNTLAFLPHDPVSHVSGTVAESPPAAALEWPVGWNQDDLPVGTQFESAGGDFGVWEVTAPGQIKMIKDGSMSLGGIGDTTTLTPNAKIPEGWKPLVLPASKPKTFGELKEGDEFTYAGGPKVWKVLGVGSISGWAIDEKGEKKNFHLSHPIEPVEPEPVVKAESLFDVQVGAVVTLKPGTLYNTSSEELFTVVDKGADGDWVLDNNVGGEVVVTPESIASVQQPEAKGTPYESPGGFIVGQKVGLGPVWAAAEVGDQFKTGGGANLIVSDKTGNSVTVVSDAWDGPLEMTYTTAIAHDMTYLGKAEEGKPPGPDATDKYLNDEFWPDAEPLPMVGDHVWYTSPEGVHAKGVVGDVLPSGEYGINPDEGGHTVWIPEHDLLRPGTPTPDPSAPKVSAGGWKVGDPVLVKEGPWEGMKGIVTDIEPDGPGSGDPSLYVQVTIGNGAQGLLHVAELEAYTEPEKPLTFISLAKDERASLKSIAAGGPAVTVNSGITLKAAGLIQSVNGGDWQLTPKGEAVLATQAPTEPADLPTAEIKWFKVGADAWTLGGKHGVVKEDQNTFKKYLLLDDGTGLDPKSELYVADPLAHGFPVTEPESPDATAMPGDVKVSDLPVGAKYTTFSGTWTVTQHLPHGYTEIKGEDGDLTFASENVVIKSSQVVPEVVPGQVYSAGEPMVGAEGQPIMKGQKYALKFGIGSPEYATALGSGNKPGTVMVQFSDGGKSEFEPSYFFPDDSAAATTPVAAPGAFVPYKSAYGTGGKWTYDPIGTMEPGTKFKGKGKEPYWVVSHIGPETSYRNAAGEVFLAKAADRVRWLADPEPETAVVPEPATSAGVELPTVGQKFKGPSGSIYTYAGLESGELQFTGEGPNHIDLTKTPEKWAEQSPYWKPVTDSPVAPAQEDPGSPGAAATAAHLAIGDWFVNAQGERTLIVPWIAQPGVPAVPASQATHLVGYGVSSAKPVLYSRGELKGLQTTGGFQIGDKVWLPGGGNAFAPDDIATVVGAQSLAGGDVVKVVAAEGSELYMKPHELAKVATVETIVPDESPTPVPASVLQIGDEFTIGDKNGINGAVYKLVKKLPGTPPKIQTVAHDDPSKVGNTYDWGSGDGGDGWPKIKVVIKKLAPMPPEEPKEPPKSVAQPLVDPSMLQVGDEFTIPEGGTKKYKLVAPPKPGAPAQITLVGDQSGELFDWGAANAWAGVKVQITHFETKVAKPVSPSAPPDDTLQWHDLDGYASAWGSHGSYKHDPIDSLAPGMMFRDKTGDKFVFHHATADHAVIRRLGTGEWLKVPLTMQNNKGGWMPVRVRVVS